MKRVAITITLLSILFTAALSRQQDENRFAVAGLKEREVEIFFNSFKEAVAKDDKRKIAAMVSYPIKVYLRSDRTVKIANSARFVKFYDRIFDQKFKDIIAATEFKDLWAKSSGVATPRGEIWINGIAKNPKFEDNYVIKVTALNGPMRP
ncbi:MAG TPA: hypothetical protein VJ306_07010 [Pyrinomonadaceae bacterium]|jgi:hypothetical protein|nr:hypothetical protein [Pyrinomonadaceae bacterium]